MLRSIVFLKGFLKTKRFKSSVLLFWVAIALVTVYLWLQKRDESLPITEYDDIITECSERYGLSKALIYAVIECESGFDEKAVSPVGASGLMQLMPETFEWILPEVSDKERDIFDPSQNVEAGCKYLSYLIKRFKLTETALAAYNAGEGTVAAWLKSNEYSLDGIGLSVIPYAETRFYVSKVTRKAAEYEKALCR